MKTKIDLGALEEYLTKITPPEYLVADLIAIEEDYTNYHLRYDPEPDAADKLYNLRELRKQLQLLI